MNSTPAGTIEADLASNPDVRRLSLWPIVVLAAGQVVLHLLLVGYDYWQAENKLDQFAALEFIRNDLARPLFEPYGFCGAFTQYAPGQKVALGVDLPAYVLATLIHSAWNLEATCVDALMTPRGQLITSVLVFPLWLVAGMSARRIALRRWHPPLASRWARAAVAMPLTLAPLGVLAILCIPLALLGSDVASALQLAGSAIWFLYFSALSTERLRLWPLQGL